MLMFKQCICMCYINNKYNYNKFVDIMNTLKMDYINQHPYIVLPIVHTFQKFSPISKCIVEYGMCDVSD